MYLRNSPYNQGPSRHVVQVAQQVLPDFITPVSPTVTPFVSGNAKKIVAFPRAVAPPPPISYGTPAFRQY